MSKLVVVGIDTGTANVGICTWSVLDGKVAGVATEALAKKRKESTGSFLNRVHGSLNRIFTPTHIAIEGVHVRFNITTTIQLAKCLGVVEAFAAEIKAPYVEIAPAHWKRVLTGNGTADYDRTLMTLKAEAPFYMWDLCVEHELAAAGIAFTAAHDLLAEERTQRLKAA